MTDLQKLEAVKRNYDNMVCAEQLFKELKSRAESTTHITMGTKVQKASSGNRHEEAMIRMMDARDRYTDCLNQYIESLWGAYSVLDGIKRPEWYEILFKRYIQRKTWKRVADETGFSSRNCMILHKTAAKYLESTDK